MIIHPVGTCERTSPRNTGNPQIINLARAADALDCSRERIAPLAQ